MVKYLLLDAGIPLIAVVLLPIIAIVLFCLVVLVETIALQLLRWGDFRRSLQASLRMNIASTILGIPLLGIVEKLDLVGIVILWAVSVLVEMFILFILHWREDRMNIIAAVVANTASYLLLIIPTYLLSK